MTVVEKFLLDSDFSPKLDYKSNLTAVIIFIIICGVVFLIDYYVYRKQRINKKFEREYYIFSESWYGLSLAGTFFGQIGTMFMLIFDVHTLSLIPIIFIVGPCFPVVYAKRYNMIMKKSKELIKEEKAAEYEKEVSAMKKEC